MTITNHIIMIML